MNTKKIETNRMWDLQLKTESGGEFIKIIELHKDTRGCEGAPYIIIPFEAAKEVAKYIMENIKRNGG